MTNLLECPPDWITPTTSPNTGLSRQEVSRAYRARDRDELEFLDVLQTWEALVECVEDGKVYARLFNQNEETSLVFELDTFELGGPIEEGSTFRALLVRDRHGFRKWRNLPNVPAKVTSEQLEQWDREVAHFADSGL